jgi:glutamate--cysteine ligase
VTGIKPQYLLAPGTAGPDEPIRSRGDLVAFIEAGAKPNGPQLVGVELERLPLLADGSAAPYASEGGPSVTALLLWLARERGYEPTEQEGHVVGLVRGDAQVHLEPGAQVELALPPRTTAREIEAVLRDWRDDLVAGAAATGVSAVALGLQPVTPVGAIGWVPKQRYAIMSRHLGARGPLAHHMMKATAGVQFTFDFADAQDAAGIVETALAASPVVNALAANSPLEEGRRNGWMTKRPEIWAGTDPDRTGLLSSVTDGGGYTHERYVSWATGVPVMFVVREGRWIELGDRTFARLLEEGVPGHGPALLSDWALHLTTLFPEVRVKQQIEIRGADSCSIELNAALAALWRGLLYDAGSRGRARSLHAGATAGERERTHRDAARRGLDARAGGVPLAEWASEILDIADEGLARLPSGEADRALLAPLREIAGASEPPAKRLLADWDREGPKALLRRL